MQRPFPGSTPRVTAFILGLALWLAMAPAAPAQTLSRAKPEAAGEAPGEEAETGADTEAQDTGDEPSSAAVEAGGDEELAQLVSQAEQLISEDGRASAEEIARLSAALEALQAALARKVEVLQETPGDGTAEADEQVEATGTELQSVLSEADEETNDEDSSNEEQSGEAASQEGEPEASAGAGLGRAREFVDLVLGSLERIQVLRSTLRSESRTEGELAEEEPSDEVREGDDDGDAGSEGASEAQSTGEGESEEKRARSPMALPSQRQGARVLSSAVSAPRSAGPTGTVNGEMRDAAPAIPMRAALGQIHGQVREANHAAVSGAKVELRQPGKTGLVANAVSDRRGEFILSALPGTYEMKVLRPTFRIASSAVRVTAGGIARPHVVLAAAAKTTEAAHPNGRLLSVQGRPARAELRGQVTDLATGRGIAGASISVDGRARGTTDGRGGFAITGLEPGPHRVRAARAGFSPGERSVNLSAGKMSRTVTLGLRSASSPARHPPGKPRHPPGKPKRPRAAKP